MRIETPTSVNGYACNKQQERERESASKQPSLKIKFVGTRFYNQYIEKLSQKKELIMVDYERVEPVSERTSSDRPDPVSGRS